MEYSESIDWITLVVLLLIIIFIICVFMSIISLSISQSIETQTKYNYDYTYISPKVKFVLHPATNIIIDNVQHTEAINEKKKKYENKVVEIDLTKLIANYKLKK